MSGRALETLAKGGLLAATAKESRQEQEPTDFVLEARRGTAECVLPLSLSLYPRCSPKRPLGDAAASSCIRDVADTDMRATRQAFQIVYRAWEIALV